MRPGGAEGQRDEEQQRDADEARRQCHGRATLPPPPTGERIRTRKRERLQAEEEEAGGGNKMGTGDAKRDYPSLRLSGLNWILISSREMERKKERWRFGFVDRDLGTRVCLSLACSSQTAQLSSMVVTIVPFG